MKTIKQYRKEIQALMDEANKMDSLCVAENRDLTDAERESQGNIMDQIDKLRDIVAVMERKAALQASLGESNEPTTVVSPAATQRAPAVIKKDKESFSSFGEQMMAVMRAGVPGGHADPRLFNAATGANESVPSDGGFLVQQDFAKELLHDAIATGVLSSRVKRRVPISRNSNSMKINGIDETSRATGSRYGGITSYWADEAEEKTASKPKFRKIELNLKKLIGLCYATDELLDDATALEQTIRDGFTSEFGFQIDDAIVNGVGGGQPLGILQAGSLVSVGKETGQQANTIMAENIIKMYSRMFAGSLSSAEWFINQNCLPQLLTMSIAVGTGGVPVYLPPGNTLINAPGGALLGRPVTPIEQAASVGTQGDVIFADIGNGYILAEKGGIKSDMSIHVRFVYDESVFRFVLRVDGQPVRASALTPYKGGASYTQSHFIALDTRS